MARNVSTKRDLITFSRLVCEFSDDKKGQEGTDGMGAGRWSERPGPDKS
jgi:hypothetical protein